MKLSLLSLSITWLYMTHGAELPPPCHQTLAYLEEVSPDGVRNPAISDRTSANMPCIQLSDVNDRQDKEYKLWHGHCGKDHVFTVKSSDFEQLDAGFVVEVYTSVLNNHKHAVHILPLF